jgi:hypothetical protein
VKKTPFFGGIGLLKKNFYKKKKIFFFYFKKKNLSLSLTEFSENIQKNSENLTTKKFIC